MTELLRGALATGLKASYVLFDSWFSTPANILALKELELDVIAMVKETLKVRPLYKEHLVPLSSDVSLSAEENRFIVLVTSLRISRCRKPSSSWWGWMAYVSEKLCLSEEGPSARLEVFPTSLPVPSRKRLKLSAQAIF